MAFDVNAARKAGYSEVEIAEYLGQQNKFDAAGAIKAGYNPAELINYLSKQAPAQPQERTFLGGAKELFKGLAPGAVGLVESAATGASALLPESMEKTAREKIKSVATAAKEPFTAAAGYEESVPRKLGEAIGSTAPFLLAGPLGLAGRAAAVGLGVGAGAGEARTRAEAEDATADQRGTATALGTLPGALEAFAPFRILSRIPEAATASAVQMVKRALLASGEEAAQETASGLAQNMIARGIYKPEQALIEGLGEQAAYGGATGAIVQGLMDLALGRRAKGSATTPPPAPPPEPEEVVPGAKIPEEAPVGTQGTLFTPREMGKKVPPVKEEPAPAQPAAAQQGEQTTLGLDFQRDYIDLFKERDRLREGEQTPEVKARIAELTEQLKSYDEADIGQRQAEKIIKEEKRAKEAEQKAADEVAAQRFPGLAGPTTAAITQADIDAIGLPLRTSKQWITDNVLGKTVEEIKALVARDPKLISGKGARAEVLKALIAPQPKAFEEKPSDTTITKADQPQGELDLGGGEPSVGVPSEPADTDVVQPGAGVSATTGAPATPDGLGLAPAGQPASKRTKAKGTTAPAVTPNAPVTPTPTPLTTAPAAPVEGPAEDNKPAPAPTVAKEDKTPPAPKAAEPVKSRYERLLDIANDDAIPAATRKQAEKQMDLLDDPTMNRGKEARKGNEDYADRFLNRVEGLKSVAIAEGQSLDSLKNEIKNTKGKLGTALRRMVESGKVVLEDAHPSGKKLGGFYDGEKVTLYANGIPPGQSMAVALHEVGAHLGMRNLLGKKQYNAVIDRILDMVAKPDNSIEAKISQLAYRRIPVSDFKRGVGRDEMVAYFVEEMAKAEVDGSLPKVGPVRIMWNRITTAIVTSINKALGTNFGVKDFSAQDIFDIAKTSFVAESETAPTKGEIKALFSTSYTPQDVVNSMGPLTPLNERSLKQMVFGMQNEGDPTRGVKFRVAVADSAAAIEEKFSRTFNGAVRNNLGKLNPMGLYRQAQDYSKILLEYFQNGTLVKDKTTGFYRTIGTGQGAPADVFPLIYAWGEKTGRSKEQAEQFASRVLEAKRLDEVLKVNPDFPKHIKDRERAILVAEYSSDPAYAEMNAAMDKPRIALINKMVEVGRLSKETAAEWTSVVGYVPFDRIGDFTDKFSTVKKTTGRSPLTLTKDPELVGSFDRPVGNVFENYLNTMGWMVGQTMNNDARIQTLRGLEDLGFASKASRVPGTEGKTAKAYVNGEVMYWELPSRYDIAAFQDLNPPKMAIMRTLGAFSNILRKSVTILPPFALKQVTDDVQRAMLTSGVKNPGALLRMTLANFGKIAVAELRGIQHPIVKEFGALGLTGEYDFEAGKPAVSLLKDLGYRKRGMFETILHRLDGITRASDLAVRKAIYDQTLKESNNDMLLAQTRAREFINFRRRGSSELVAIGTATIPFFNAYVQGMDVLYRAASGKDSSSSVGRAQARQLFYSRAGTVIALSSLYALVSGEDEDYQDMDLRTRNSNWILPGGFKIPVPGELGAIFKVIPETVIEYLRRSGTPEEQTALEAIRSSLKYMSEQYIERTVPIPQAVKPLIEAWTNYSFFTGRELEGIYQKQQDPSMRVTSKTSELAQVISNFSRDVIGVDAVSPIQIDNMLSGYFGSTAALAVMTTDSLLNPSRVDRPLHKYALLSNYMYDPIGTRSLTEFYDEREKVGKANNTLRQLMKTDMARAEKYAAEHESELMLEGAVNSTLEQLERTRAYRKFLNSPDGAADMSKAEREKDLEELKKMEIEFTGWLREAKTELRKVQ